MARISPTNRVRRCLFPADDVTQEATVDNFANGLQESFARDLEEKMRKWNFDFVNEVPLPGDYEWFKRDGNEWIGMTNPETSLDGEKEDENCLPMKLDNESTPKSNKDRETVSPLRKRRKEDVSLCDSGVKRRISFD